MAAEVELQNAKVKSINEGRSASFKPLELRPKTQDLKPKILLTVSFDCDTGR